MFYFTLFFISTAIIILTLSPFWLTEPDELDPPFVFKNKQETKSAKDRIIEKLNELEGLYSHNEITLKEWEQNKSFLTKRYIEISRREDHLSSEEK